MPTTSPATRVTVISTTEPFERVGATHPFARWAIATMRAVRSDDSEFATVPEGAVPGSLLVERAVDYLARSSEVHDAAPLHQPGHVFELTDKLFAPYDLGGGQINLAGCVLEDRPLLRLTCLIGSDASSESAQLAHLFMQPDGERVDDLLIGQLMLSEIMPYAGKPPRLGQAELEPWIDLARQQLDFDADRHLLAITVIWCKYAAGKIRLNYGDQTGHVPFAGWAQLFATGQIVPPPFHCDHTDRDSYRVRQTDDGIITVESSLAICESSGATVLENQLQSCAVTGRRVLPKFLQTCPVSAQRMLPDQAVVCQMCSQRVSPEATKGDRCAACRRLQPISKDDPRLARLLGEYPRLDEWPHWRFSELSEVYLLVGNTLLKRILLVIEKEGLEPRHIARGGRIFGNWSRVAPDQFDQFLR